jgi:hypothetical protein
MAVITNDDSRDLAIKILEKLVEAGFVKDCIDTDDEDEFNVQDIIHEEINEALEIEED